jgi:membrane-associated phospholipid phosphatase
MFKKTSAKAPFLRAAILFAVVLAASIAFGSLADEVHEGDTLSVDTAILKRINAHATPFLDDFFVVVTQFGGVLAVAAIALGIACILLLRKRYAKATFFAMSMGGALLLNISLKYIFERARPDIWNQLVTETSFSFPSGHAMASAALALSFAYIAWRKGYRAVIAVSAALYVAVIGFSRLYLGVHYPTDILAGWLVSTAWVLLMILTYRRWLIRRHSN